MTPSPKWSFMMQNYCSPLKDRKTVTEQNEMSECKWTKWGGWIQHIPMLTSDRLIIFNSGIIQSGIEAISDFL